ncbi:hypothetical protein Baya_7216 [Bagarius yarrelli]|uniref:Uncharacterized protein n=1 Tax=Bagarius yarrelli TaxID=175774 RepID=A0A556TZK5_BAGYA|nr:hypothetical protein Baya_7216 [Bagarius yarrelli]
MDVRDGAAAWEALASRDSCSRATAMEHVELEVKKKVESIGPILRSSSSSSASFPYPGMAQDLNCVLARVLMLSKRCPYQDVRERCVWLLRGVQFQVSVLQRLRLLCHTMWVKTALVCPVSHGRKAPGHREEAIFCAINNDRKQKRKLRKETLDDREGVGVGCERETDKLSN